MSDLQGYQEGPLSMLRECVKNKTKVIIDIGGKGDKNLLHMILRDIVEEWIERRSKVKIHRKRNIAKMFLPGHSVKIIVKVTE